MVVPSLYTIAAKSFLFDLKKIIKWDHLLRIFFFSLGEVQAYLDREEAKLKEAKEKGIDMSPARSQRTRKGAGSSRRGARSTAGTVRSSASQPQPGSSSSSDYVCVLCGEPASDVGPKVVCPCGVHVDMGHELKCMIRCDRNECKNPDAQSYCKEDCRTKYHQHVDAAAAPPAAVSVRVPAPLPSSSSIIPETQLSQPSAPASE